MSGKKVDLFESCIGRIERMSLKEKEKQYAFALRRLSERPRRQYHKIPYGENNDTCVIVIFWAPDGKTRPHSHGGSPARIRVVHGALAQDEFRIGDKPPAEWLGSTIHSTRKDWDMVEEPGGVHRVRNCLVTECSISVHEFKLDFSMEIFDIFESRLRWPVLGGEDTLGNPPANAVPIWR